MSKHIRVENNEVVQCLDYLPENAIGDWRLAIEIEPTLIPGRQIRGSHSFDLSKTPVEIVWSVVDIPIQDRKDSLIATINDQHYKLAYAELTKEFKGLTSDINLVQSLIMAYRNKRTEIEGLLTHDDIDQFVLANNG